MRQQSDVSRGQPLNSRSKDWTGKRFHHLVMVRRTAGGGPGVGATWLVACDCGSHTEKLARDVVHGRIRTCGKCQYTSDLIARRSNRTRAGERLSRSHRRGYRTLLTRATQEGTSISLTPAEYLQLVTGECTLCADTESLVVTRRDAVHPYILGNCTAICRTCLRRKGSESLEAYTEYCIRVVQKFLNENRTHF